MNELVCIIDLTSPYNKSKIMNIKFDDWYSDSPKLEFCLLWFTENWNEKEKEKFLPLFFAQR